MRGNLQTHGKAKSTYATQETSLSPSQPQWIASTSWWRGGAVEPLPPWQDVIESNLWRISIRHSQLLSVQDGHSLVMLEDSTPEQQLNHLASSPAMSEDSNFDTYSSAFQLPFFSKWSHSSGWETMWCLRVAVTFTSLAMHTIWSLPLWLFVCLPRKNGYCDPLLSFNRCSCLGIHYGYYYIFRYASTLSLSFYVTVLWWTNFHWV